MIIVTGVIEADTDDIDTLKQPIVDMVAATRAEEGCIDYAFSLELGETNTLRLTETWRDAASLKAHFQAPHMAEFQKLLQAHPPRRADISFYEATEIDMPV